MNKLNTSKNYKYFLGRFADKGDLVLPPLDDEFIEHYDLLENVPPRKTVNIKSTTPSIVKRGDNIIYKKEDDN